MNSACAKTECDDRVAWPTRVEQCHQIKRVCLSCCLIMHNWNRLNFSTLAAFGSSWPFKVNFNTEDDTLPPSLTLSLSLSRMAAIVFGHVSFDRDYFSTTSIDCSFCCCFAVQILSDCQSIARQYFHCINA